MTQALNLANFANKLNTTGQADTTSLQSGTYPISISGNAATATTATTATTAGALSGTLAASGGGTGLTSPGASGNVLTSNGAGWISAAPQTPTSFGAIGTCVMAGLALTPGASTLYVPNTTYAGSFFRMSPGLQSFFGTSGAYNPSLTGTWRLLSTVYVQVTTCPCSGSPIYTSSSGLFVRIS